MPTATTNANAKHGAISTRKQPCALLQYVTSLTSAEHHPQIPPRRLELLPPPRPASPSGLTAVCSARMSPFGRSEMSTMRIMAAAALAAAFAVSTAWAQQQTQRVAGTIDKVEGKTLYIKSARGPVTLTLADNALIVARGKATAADIKAGHYVASGGVPQPDGPQKAGELRIFPERMRGNGDGHRPGVPGAPNGTMTNGAGGPNVT